MQLSDTSLYSALEKVLKVLVDGFGKGLASLIPWYLREKWQLDR